MKNVGIGRKVDEVSERAVVERKERKKSVIEL